MTNPEFSAGWTVEPDEDDFPAPEVKLDLRTKGGRAAAGLPPKEAPNKGQSQPRNETKAPPVKTYKPSPVPKGKTDYREGITGISQLVSFGLSFSNPADAQAVLTHTPAIAQALHDLAMAKPEFARILDKLMSAGPYGALITAVFPLIVQILINHDKLPDAVGAALGLV